MGPTISRDVHYPVWELEVQRDPRLAPCVDRLGGAPIGLSAARWPSCGVCGVPLAFVAQLGHDAERLPIGEGHALFVFLCQNNATFLECGLHAGVPGNTSGAHAIFTAPLDATLASTPRPGPAGPRPLPAIVARAWTRDVEHAPADAALILLHGMDDGRHGWPRSVTQPDDPELESAEARARREGTKLGGFPDWMQDPYFQLEPGSLRFVCIGQVECSQLAPAPSFLDVPWVVAQQEELDATPLTARQRIYGENRTLRRRHRVPVRGGEQEMELLVYRNDRNSCVLDEALVRRTADDGTCIATPLDHGRLYLLRDTETSELSLSFIGR